MQTPIELEFLKLLNRYFTPFAILLVFSGVSFSNPNPTDAYYSLLVLAVSVAFNIATAFVAMNTPHLVRFLGYTRMAVNLGFNTILFYLLGSYWGPMWLLFLLGPVAAAVYGTKQRTILSAGISSILLLGVYLVKGAIFKQTLGQALMHICFIFFLGLFVHALSQLAREREGKLAP